MERTFARLALVAPWMRDADLLLFRRGPGLASRLIAACGRSDYSHAGMVVWRDVDGHRCPCCAELVQWRGGRCLPLATHVVEAPGRIDWYRANRGGRWPECHRSRAARVMMELVEQPYGWRALAKAGLLHLPVVRLFVRPAVDDEEPARSAPFCSMGPAIAWRYGGVDVVPNLADRLVEPGDLARSLFFQYAATLID